MIIFYSFNLCLTVYFFVYGRHNSSANGDVTEQIHTINRKKYKNQYAYYNQTRYAGIGFSKNTRRGFFNNDKQQNK